MQNNMPDKTTGFDWDEDELEDLTPKEPIPTKGPILLTTYLGYDIYKEIADGAMYTERGIRYLYLAKERRGSQGYTRHITLCAAISEIERQLGALDNGRLVMAPDGTITTKRARMQYLTETIMATENRIFCLKEAKELAILLGDQEARSTFDRSLSFEWYYAGVKAVLEAAKRKGIEVTLACGYTDIPGNPDSTQSWIKTSIIQIRKDSDEEPTPERSTRIRRARAAQLMTLDEVTETFASQAVWIESKASAGVTLAIYSREHYPNIYFQTPFGDTYYHGYSYGKSWRCWTERPTDTARKSAEWEEQERG